MHAPSPGSWVPQSLAAGRRLDGRFAAGIRGEGNFLVPSLRVDEDDDALLVVAAIPGAERAELSVSLEGELLRIAGERTGREDDVEERVHRRSRYLSRFTREVRLPHAVDGRRAEARFDHGELRIRLPVVDAPTAKTRAARRIRIT